MILLNSALVFLVVVVGLVSGSDVLYIQHAPSYYQITPESVSETPLKTSQLSDLVAATLGFSITKDFHWDGIKSSTFFERPKAAIIVEFDGFDNVNSNIAKNKFPLSADVDTFLAYSVITNQIYSRYPDDKLLTLDITNDNNCYLEMAEYPDILNNIDPDPDRMEMKLKSKDSAFVNKHFKALNISRNVDLEFLAEMQLFIDVINAMLDNADKVHLYKASDFICLRSLAFKNLKNIYGADSREVKEALEVIGDVLKQIEAGLTKLYGDNYLMLVLAIDFNNEVPRSRLGRSLLQETMNVNSSSINLSPSYDQDYAAMFNIILFVSLLLSLIVFAIALGMWHIDPGRDSIIYRMTNQRMKKDQ